MQIAADTVVRFTVGMKFWVVYARNVHIDSVARLVKGEAVLAVSGGVELRMYGSSETDAWFVVKDTRIAEVGVWSCLRLSEA